MVYTSLHDSAYWIAFKDIITPQLVNLESVAFCNFTGAKALEIEDINYFLEQWKLLEIMELPDNINVNKMNFKSCRSLKKIILNGDYDSEKLNSPQLPKWIQVIRGVFKSNN